MFLQNTRQYKVEVVVEVDEDDDNSFGGMYVIDVSESGKFPLLVKLVSTQKFVMDVSQQRSFLTYCASVSLKLSVIVNSVFRILSHSSSFSHSKEQPSLPVPATVIHIKNPFKAHTQRSPCPRVVPFISLKGVLGTLAPDVVLRRK
jgi:hypothetical protein